MPPCMFHVIMTNTKIIFAGDVDMGGNGSDSMAVYGADAVLNIEVIWLSHSSAISGQVTCAKKIQFLRYMYPSLYSKFSTAQ